MDQSKNKIINFEDARRMARQVSTNQLQNQTVKQESFDKIFSNFKEISPELAKASGIEEISVLLTLPDEQFALLAPIFLEELEKSYGSTVDKIFLAQSLNAAGLKYEDIQNTFKALTAAVDTEFSSLLSAKKRDFLKRMYSISYNAIADTEGVIKRTVNVPIELTSENAKIPTYAHLGDGAVDLYSPADYTINPGETVVIPCDIKVALPYGYAFLIHPRSGTSAKTKLRVANSVGLVDSQYKGVIGVIVENIEPPVKDITYEFDDNGRPILTSVLHGKSYSISKGERFAQMRLVEVPTANFFQVESVDGIGDDRGGGFGSSGTN